MKKAIVTSLLLLAVAFVFACDRLVSNSNTSNGTSSQRPAESRPGTDPRAEIEAAARKFLAAKAYRGTAVGEGAMPMRIQIEYVAPDRYRIRSEPAFETIVIGDESYTRSGDRWTKLPMKAPFQASLIRDIFTEEGLKRMTDTAYVGEEAVGGDAALLYSFKIPATGEAPGQTTKLWVRRADRLPVKGLVVFDSGPVNKITLEYAYPSDLTIEPPVSVARP